MRTTIEAALTGRTVRALGAVAAMAAAGVGLAACAGAQPAPEVSPAAPRSARPQAALQQDTYDPFADFGGQRVPAGEPFRLMVDPVGIEGCRVLVSLAKVSWTTMETPSGERRDATAFLTVQKGEQVETLRLAETDTRAAFGCRFTAEAAGEDYHQPTESWQPWVDLTVTSP